MKLIQCLGIILGSTFNIDFDNILFWEKMSHCFVDHLALIDVALFCED
jgi:hypothetical protein